MSRKARWPWITVGILAGLGVVYLVGAGAWRQLGHGKKGPVAIELSRSELGQGDFVKVKVFIRAGKDEGEPLRPSVRVVDEEGREMIGVGGAREVAVTFDEKNKCWTGNWAVPWGTEGKFRVVAEVKLPGQGGAEAGDVGGPQGEGEKVLKAEDGFVVGTPKVEKAPGGLCIATLESLTDYRGARLKGPGGEVGNWRVLLDWAEWMGANTFWYSAGWTASWEERLTDEDPWVKSNLEQTRLFGREAKKRGMKFGTWVLAYATHGKRELLPNYKFAWGFEPKTGRCKQTTAISLLDGKRVADIAKLVKKLAEEEDVDMVGLDYIRTVKGGYEMVDEFVEEMRPGGLPAGWERMGREERMAWLGRQVEVTREPGISDAWNWWRARKIKGIVEEIKRQSGIKKPLWAFTLSWQHGMQHGQDPLMMMGAGVDLDAVMLYESNRAQYDQLVKDWNVYVKVGEANLAVGEVVDWDLHQRTLAPAGPEEAYLRARTATKYILGEREGAEGTKTRRTKPDARNSKPTAAGATVVQGVFWHDLERLLRGKLGPYPSQEWALAGGKVFSEVKRDWGISPVELRLDVPAKVKQGETFKARVNLKNEGERDLEGVKVEIVKTVGIVAKGEESRELGALSSGAQGEVEFELRAGGDLRKRGNRVMVAVRCSWGDGNQKEKAMTFEYLTAG